jgi:hypothetical protein
MARRTGTRTAWRGVAPLRRHSTLVALALVVASTSCSTESVAEESLGGSGSRGVFVGFNQGERLLQLEQDVGVPFDVIVTMADARSAEAMNGSVYGQFAAPDAYLPGLSDRVNVVVSVPIALGPGGMPRTEDGRATIGTNLRNVAAGQHDADFRLVARYLVDAGYRDAIIRLGHEFDGDWAPYSVRGNLESYITAYRHVHGVLAAESPGFRFDWTSMVPDFVEYGVDAYPGDDVVDIIGIDVYWREPEPISDEQWQRRFEPVLQAHLEFAQARGKPVSYPEWGRSLVDEPRFVELMYGWFSQLPRTGPGRLEYQAYFNEVGLLDDEFYPYDLEKLPDVKRRYIELFGAG